MPTPRLRWRMRPRETGLRAVSAGPRGHELRDAADGKVYAMASPKWQTDSAYGHYKGWFWVAGWGSGVPYKNTCDTPVATVEAAKAAATEYVKSFFATKVD